MFSYRYKDMPMNGLWQGFYDLSTVDTLNSNMVMPISIDMKMHMIGLIFWTIMLLGYVWVLSGRLKVFYRQLTNPD